MNIQKYINHRAVAIEKLLFHDRTGEEQHKDWPNRDYCDEVEKLRKFAINHGGKGLKAYSSFSYFTI